MFPLGPHVQEFYITLVIDQAQHLAHRLLANFPASEGDHLIQQRESVPHPSVGLLCDGSESILGSGKTFLLEHGRQAIHDV